MKRPKLAFVVQRYGSEINGGSELLCRMIAERMAEFYEVDVFTSCALKYHLRFENDFVPGDETLNRVRVRRFSVSTLRPIDQSFSELDSRVLNHTATPQEERLWLEWVGPYSQDLLDTLMREKDDYCSFIFFTYLYAQTTFGLPALAHKSILVPTAHDEPPIYAKYFDTFFSQARHIVFNTEEELNFLRKRSLSKLPSCHVLGAGVEMPQYEPSVSLTQKLPSRFILYAGRIQSEKGVPTLIDAYLQLDPALRRDCPLVLVGQSYMDIPQDSSIISLGFLSDDEKNTVMSKASLFVMPSPYESLCLALLEAWLHGVPALVNGGCAVLKAHCDKSGGGIAYSTPSDLQTKLQEFLVHQNDESRHEMGERGRQYVREHYDWSVVIAAYRKVIEEVRHNPSRWVLWHRIMHGLGLILKPPYVMVKLAKLQKKISNFWFNRTRAMN